MPASHDVEVSSLAFNGSSTGSSSSARAAGASNNISSGERHGAEGRADSGGSASSIGCSAEASSLCPEREIGDAGLVGIGEVGRGQQLGRELFVSGRGELCGRCRRVDLVHTVNGRLFTREVVDSAGEHAAVRGLIALVIKPTRMALGQRGGDDEERNLRRFLVRRNGRWLVDVGSASARDHHATFTTLGQTQAQRQQMSFIDYS